jgi:hypothetical protein
VTDCILLHSAPVSLKSKGAAKEILVVPAIELSKLRLLEETFAEERFQYCSIA